MLQYYFSLRQFGPNEMQFLYTVQRLTYIRGLILELSRNFTISATKISG